MGKLAILIRRSVARALTSTAREQLRRRRARIARRLLGRSAQVHYFHQADDPYSHLCAPLLSRLAADCAIELVPHLVGPPEDGAAPDRERLAAWSQRDAATLAAGYGITVATCDRAPDGEAVRAAEGAMLAALRDGHFVQALPAISDALWQGGKPPQATMASDVATAKAEGNALRKRLGHYLGATFFFGGEWYWGVDRLHYLEERLRSEGLARDPARPFIAPVREPRFAPVSAGARRPVLHWFCSFRSPYTYLSAPRVRQLAEHYGAELRIRYVLPMVMRGLPVPREKRGYILADAAREARRLGMRFGDIVDPVGRPVERGYAVLEHAIGAGKGIEFATSFLQGAWADGIDAGSAAGLERIAQRAGLDAAFVARALADPSWREVAAANRAELLAMNLWGVPSFRVDERPGHWGQDRLWAVEDDLIAARSVVDNSL